MNNTPTRITDLSLFPAKSRFYVYNNCACWHGRVWVQTPTGERFEIDNHNKTAYPAPAVITNYRGEEIEWRELDQLTRRHVWSIVFNK